MMTWEDALASYERLYDYMVGDDDAVRPDYGEFIELSHYIRSALCGPTKEQVERMRGEWEPFGGKYISRKKCSRCGWDGQEHIKFYSWCPACGAPMTDEAVDMMVRRWREALENA